MDFVIKYNESELLRLPVPPPDFTIQAGNQTQTVTVTEAGELALWGPEKLAGISIASFFPHSYSPLYCSYQGFPKPWDCIAKLDAWRNSGNPVRIIITDKGKDVDINMEVLIETLDSTMQDASGDVYFTLAMRQYRRINIPQVAGNQTVAEPVRTAPPSVPAAPVAASASQRRYTVKSGDTLWGIAKRYYGSGSRYPAIAAANPIIKDPNRIYPGWDLLIP